MVTKIEQVFAELSHLYELGREIESAGLSRLGESDVRMEEAVADHDYPALTDRELSRLLAKARATGDAELRRLVKHHVCLREAAERLLQRVKDEAGESDDLVRVAEHFVHADWKRVDGE